MIGKAQFFSSRSKGEMLKREVRSISARRPSEYAAQIHPGEEVTYVLESPLIPGGFTSRTFLKHGRRVLTRRHRSLEEAVESRTEPVFLRDSAFTLAYDGVYAGYSFKPIIGTDKRARDVHLVECLEGARIYAYSSQQPRGACDPSIELTIYDQAQRVEREGTEIVCRVPSRTPGKRRYDIRWSSVPIIDTQNKWGIAYNVVTDHVCPSKRFDIRYRFRGQREDSKVVSFDAHDIASWLAILDETWHNRKNLVPLQMSQFAIPTQETVDFYMTLMNNCLIRDPKERSGNKLRKLNMAEREILLWGLIKLHGHDKTFFATEKVRDYEWN